jgi:hypothetical protein
MKLDLTHTRYALGLCASCASGIKSQFSTMGKPPNSGLSAANCLEACAPVALGVTSADDELMGN